MLRFSQDFRFLGHAAHPFPVGHSCFPVLLCFTVALITGCRVGGLARDGGGRAVGGLTVMRVGCKNRGILKGDGGVVYEIC